MSDSIIFKNETITPEWAAKALKNNVDNRNISNVRVKEYAKNMKKGTWTYCPSPICFDCNGKLIDGQHRLSAVIMGGGNQLICWLRTTFRKNQ